MRVPRTAFTVWVATASLLIVLVFAGVTALTVGIWLADPGYEETNPVLDLGFFALGAVLIGTGLVVQLRAPERHVAGIQQATIGLLALSVAGLIGDRVEPLWGGLVLLLATGVAAALHPARRELFRGGARPNAALAALALAAGVPAVLYAAAMLVLARESGPSCFLGQCARGDRFAEVAALAVAIVLVTLLASARTAGWRVSAWSAGLAAVVLGSTSVALPDVTGALGRPGGAIVATWGLLVIATAERQARADRDRESTEGEWS